MPTLIFGVVVLVLVLWALNIISKVDPRIAARVMKLGGGLVALGLAVFLGLRGELGIAIPLGACGLGLLGWGVLAVVVALLVGRWYRSLQEKP